VVGKRTVNEGLQQSGGSIHAEVVAIGRNARARKTAYGGDGPGRRELQDKLTALIAALHEHGDRLPSRAEIEDTTERVKAELEQPKPNRLTLTALLSGIADGAKTVGAIANAAAALKACVVALL
jgi:hypothetical protein